MPSDVRAILRLRDLLRSWCRSAAMKAPVFVVRHRLGHSGPDQRALSVRAMSILPLRIAAALTILATGFSPVHAVETASVPAVDTLAPAVSVVPATLREVVERAV